MIVDAEALVTAYLKAQTGVRVVGRTPTDTKTPWVRVTLLDDPSTDGGVAERAFECYLQLDCCAGTNGSQQTAHDTYAAIRTALADIHNHTHALGVVTGAPKIRGSRQPDEAYEPAMERYVISATIWMHR